MMAAIGTFDLHFRTLTSYISASTAYEVKRHCGFLLNNPGATVPQETRGFNEDTFETFRLRSKEDAPDYRYMPDPNLGELVISQVCDQRVPLRIFDKTLH